MESSIDESIANNSVVKHVRNRNAIRIQEVPRHAQNYCEHFNCEEQTGNIHQTPL